MAQAPTFIGQWDASRPFGTESRTESDDYHRNFAQTVKNSFGNVNGAVTSSHQDLNSVSGLNAAGTKPLPGVGGQTVVYFYLATPPPGYTPVNPDANVRTLMVGGTGGTALGSEDPSAQPVNTTVTVNLPASTGDYTLQQADVPNLDYLSGQAVVCGTGDVTGNSGALCGNGWSSAFGVTRQTTGGGGGAHAHAIGGTAPGTGTATLAPRYAMGVLGQLDA